MRQVYGVRAQRTSRRGSSHRPGVPDGSCRGQTLAKLIKLSCSWPHPDGAETFLTEKDEIPKLFSTLACADCQSIECESCACGKLVEGEEQTSF